LVDHAGATVLSDLTTDKLLAFRTHIEADAKLKSAGTRRAYFGRAK
jgi:hypothetical protein